MKDAKPLDKFSKGKKGRQIRSAKAMNDVVNGLPRNQNWTVQTATGTPDASFKWSKAGDQEAVVLDLSKLPIGTATLTLQVDINGTIYDVKFPIVSIKEAADQ